MAAMGRDIEYDTAGRQLQDALRAVYPEASWYVGDSAGAMLNAELSDIPWESARRNLTVFAQKDGYALWMPAPRAAVEDTLETTVTYVGTRALDQLRWMREDDLDKAT